MADGALARHGTGRSLAIQLYIRLTSHTYWARRTVDHHRWNQQKHRCRLDLLRQVVKFSDEGEMVYEDVCVYSEELYNG